MVWLGLSTHGAKGHFAGQTWPLEDAYDPDWFSNHGPGLPESVGWCDQSVNPSSTAVSLRNVRGEGKAGSARTLLSTPPADQKATPASLRQYLLTQEGARQLVAHAETHGLSAATDTFMNAFLQTRGVHYITRRVLCTATTGFSSDIFPFDLSGECIYQSCQRT